MPAATVHKVLAEDLGPRWRQRFQSFEDFPAAAASIGQVHRAVWKDGRDVAVKVQYPGAGPALLSDLNQVARVARVAAGWIPGLDIKPIMDELKARVSEELDYGLEATSQATFAKAFAGHPRFAVPPVVASGERVIVAEWLEGRPLSRLISSGTQAERDAASALYLEFLLAGPQQANLLHADPHPGNYRMTPDGRLGILDFGAVNRLPNGLPPETGRLLSIAMRGDGDSVVAGLREEGFIKSSIEIDGEALLGYLHPFMEPLLVPRFQFTRGWLRGLFQHVNDPRRPQWAVGLKLNLPPSYLLIHRVWLGGIGVLCQLEGEVAARDILSAHLPGLDLPPL
jgi:predicted unusual protein kinase regulating ubiquinone biosynthesis (AarF/ABC1/UbiB family)